MRLRWPLFHFVFRNSTVNVTVECIAQLKQFQHWGYHLSGPSASEPAALAALALCEQGEIKASLKIARWLAELQKSSGSVGVTAEHDTPAWPTSLAMLVWLVVKHTSSSDEFNAPVYHALQWSLKSKGKTQPRSPEIGHDPTLLGWSWAANTHSWMEPTCMFVLALKSGGQFEHPRTRAGVEMITNRLLESGGCNFGSTVILGQATLPQVQSTGLAMLALADEDLIDVRIDQSLTYLQRELGNDTSTASLCYGLLGLTAHGHRPQNAEQLLRHVLARELSNGASCYKLALIALASMDDRSWMPQHRTRHKATGSIGL